MPPKIQPIDIDASLLGSSPVLPVRTDSGKPVLKLRLKRLFDRQFPGVLRNNSTSCNVPSEKTTSAAVDVPSGKDGLGAGELEPSSVCLAKMVQNFIEETNERQAAAKCGRNRCNCFNGNNNDSSDDEFDIFDGEFPSGGSSGDVSEVLKGLVPCSRVAERNLLADTAKILEKNKGQKLKDDLRKIVVESLSSNGYDSSICKSKWDKAPTFPAGEHEYIDVVIQGERLLIDIDFRSEFEIARSTSTYKAVLQSLPFVFVGKADRLCQIVAIVSEAAKQSLKKKGMHFPPWRNAEYMKAKWLSPHTRSTANVVELEPDAAVKVTDDDSGGDLELIFGEAEEGTGTGTGTESASPDTKETWWATVVVAKPRSMDRAGGGKVVTGLASLLKDKP